jgi:hypothetical protein
MYKYLIRPLEHGIAAQYPSVGIPGTFAPATKNVRVLRNSIRKRWGYTKDRDLGANVDIQGVALYQKQDGTRSTIILTDTDICKREPATGKTFSYLTPIYSTGTTTSVSGTSVTGNGTLWSANVSAGDKFILDADHTSDEEPDASWRTISTVNSDTSLTLSASYSGGASGDYRIRKLYSVPSGERWQFCWVGKASGNYFVAVNGSENAQYWDGDAATMATIDATYGQNARYCRSFGDRLILADKNDETNTYTRNPFLIGWSTISNPVDLDYSDDSSAGRKSFTETGDFITGLGVAGSTLAVFKRDGVHLGYSTDDATWPFNFPVFRPGVGCIAPYSIVEAMGTCFWLGENDFYRLEGDQAIAMGENAIYKIYDVINATEAQNCWGFVNQLEHEILWAASSSGGTAQYVFSYDYKYNEWNMGELADYISAGGIGDI